MKYTIQSLSTDHKHTDTLENLVVFVNNHPDCRARDYEIINGSHLNGINPNPTFIQLLGLSIMISLLL